MKRREELIIRCYDDDSIHENDPINELRWDSRYDVFTYHQGNIVHLIKLTKKSICNGYCGEKDIRGDENVGTTINIWANSRGESL